MRLSPVAVTFLAVPALAQYVDKYDTKGKSSKNPYAASNTYSDGSAYDGRYDQYGASYSNFEEYKYGGGYQAASSSQYGALGQVQLSDKQKKQVADMAAVQGDLKLRVKALANKASHAVRSVALDIADIAADIKALEQVLGIQWNSNLWNSNPWNSNPSNPWNSNPWNTGYGTSGKYGSYGMSGNYGSYGTSGNYGSYGTSGKYDSYGTGGSYGAGAWNIGDWNVCLTTLNNYGQSGDWGTGQYGQSNDQNYGNYGSSWSGGGSSGYSYSSGAY
ncbi:MAG: hypothetical protein MHM6MM_000397 [Cercozoa sp. M6MM]